MSLPDRPAAPGSILARGYALTTVGTFALVFFAAFEALAVTTVMPSVAYDLDGVRLYALAFAAPLASGVVGMVATGQWSDRSGAARPLVVSIVLFGLGLVVCGLAPTMPVLVAGRLVQGLGGGGLTVGLYVVVGKVFPGELQPSVFAAFAAAWVLPALVGPSLAAWIASFAGWRWVFLSVVALVAAATLLIWPALRRLPDPERQEPEAATSAPGAGRLAWAVLAAAAVLTLGLLGEGGAGRLGSALAAVVVLVALRALVPVGTLRGRRGLPSVIATRGSLSASFFSLEAYLPFVLQERWGWTPWAAGAVLAAAGVLWSVASQVQARLRRRITDTGAMVGGATLLLAGAALACAVVGWHGPPALLVAGYAVAAAGMGTGYPRTSVATLAVSSDADRGAHSAALSIADSLGGALALAVAGVAFHVVGDGASFTAVYAAAVLWSLLAVAAARRTRG